MSKSKRTISTEAQVRLFESKEKTFHLFHWSSRNNFQFVLILFLCFPVVICCAEVCQQHITYFLHTLKRFLENDEDVEQYFTCYKQETLFVSFADNRRLKWSREQIFGVLLTFELNQMSISHHWPWSLFDSTFSHWSSDKWRSLDDESNSTKAVSICSSPWFVSNLSNWSELEFGKFNRWTINWPINWPRPRIWWNVDCRCEAMPFNAQMTIVSFSLINSICLLKEKQRQMHWHT